MSTIVKPILRTLMIVVIASLSGFQVWAGAATIEPKTAIVPTSLNQGLKDPQELENFVDGVIAAQLQAYHIPGATVSVVKDGELYFAKGYGYADLEKLTPVIANKTLFFPGSVSKLFTWTAVMQLAEQGKVDLNANINIYQTSRFPILIPYPSR